MLFLNYCFTLLLSNSFIILRYAITFGHRSLLSLCHGIQLPDLVHVLFDRTVRRELACAGRIHHSHAGPSLVIAVSLLDSLLRFRIRTEVSKNEVLVGRAVVVREQRIVDRPEQLRITVKCTVHELDQDLADFRVIVENIIRVITAVMLIVDDFIGGQTEDERVLLADFLYDLNVRAVHGSDRRSAIQHELHISGTGRFLGCCRDLLGYIRCRENDLAVGDLVILNEDDLQLVMKGRIIVDGLRDRVNQLDDQLRDLIACRCFCTENKCSRIELHSRILEQLIPEVHDVQDIQELSLVLMQTLDLYVED